MTNWAMLYDLISKTEDELSSVEANISQLEESQEYNWWAIGSQERYENDTSDKIANAYKRLRILEKLLKQLKEAYETVYDLEEAKVEGC